MILNGYTISGEEMVKFKSFRRSPLYAIYLKAVAHSPTFRALMKEHIEQIDIRPDIKNMKEDGRLPEQTNADTINKMFILAFSRVTIPLIADSVILKELEQLKLDEVIQDMKNETDIAYLLGMADESLYIEAEKMVEKGTIKEEDLAYKGLVQFYKRTGKIKANSPTIPVLEPEPKQVKQPASKPKARFNFDSENIEL
jgi:hypothetical protein